ncbi:hypothetical protein V8C37DRAFT_381735 [Trichoderma ceciliae]
MKMSMQTTAVLLHLHAGLSMGLLDMTTTYPEGCPVATVRRICLPLTTRHCPPRPNCELLRIVTQPCDCPTPMPTVAAPCPTCQTGCGTFYRTVTADCAQSKA